MELPSGRTLGTLDFVILELMAEYGFIRWSEQLIHFSSVDSHVYVGGREDFTDHPDLQWALGRKIARLVLANAHVRQDQKQQCLIGIPTAGTPLAQAAVMVDFSIRRESSDNAREKPRIIYRIMREALKAHGVHPDWVNGKADPLKHTYWTVDNTVTNGRSKLDARDRLKESGYPVDDMRHLILVDRQQGGIPNMESFGFRDIVVAYNLLDITYAFGERGLWPRKRVRAVEQEIKTHQLVW